MEGERERPKQTERQTERHIETERDRETDREKYTYRPTQRDRDRQSVLKCKSDFCVIIKITFMTRKKIMFP